MHTTSIVHAQRRDPCVTVFVIDRSRCYRRAKTCIHWKVALDNNIWLSVEAYVVFWLLSRMLNWINVTRKTLLSSCASCFLNTIYGSTGITVNEICLHKFIDGMPGFDELCEFQILPLLGIHWCLNALWKCREDRRPGRRFTSAWQLKIYTTITITNHVNCNYSVIVITL